VFFDKARTMDNVQKYYICTFQTCFTQNNDYVKIEPENNIRLLGHEYLISELEKETVFITGLLVRPIQNYVTNFISILLGCV
jgi:hypothetical protein